MVASPSSSSSSPSNYDVFLSFRGEDTRKTFTGHLKTALDREGIRTFMDEFDLKKGEEIGPNLVKAIEQSRVSIPVFSRNYGSSRWCLDELVKILERRKKVGQTVLPIFFDVDPSDVRNQTGSFAGAFCSHEEHFKAEKEKVEKWRIALREAGKLGGWNLKDVANGHEPKLVELVVKRVTSELNDMPLDVGTCTIGIDSRVEVLLEYLNVKSKDARFVGIHGMGGVGKTTIGKAIYNQIFRKFEGCSFLRNVREDSRRQNGLVGLQQKLLFNILKQECQHVSDYSQGINVIKQRFRAMKVLIVLDDVDEVEQLNALAGSPDWFGPGSRIVITTRDKDILKAVDEIYNVEPLDYNQSLQLFSMHAFMKNHPPEDYMEDSKEVVSIAGGLPLTLEVLGSSLFGKRQVEWKYTLKELKKIPLHKVHEKLKISYDALDPREKEIFLDIAFFFIGKEKENALHIWEGCGFYPKIALEVLVNKSLVKIKDDKLEMHDQLREMAKEIVFQENSMVPRMRSRLWSHEEFNDALDNQMGTNNVEGLIFQSETPLDVKAFASLDKLRLLQVDYAHLTGNFELLPSNLRWISWIGCPLGCVPTDFHPKKLVVLDLSWSNVTEVWNTLPQNKSVEKLKVLDLSHCKYLTRTPDFVGAPNLERLFLVGCGSLVKVHESIGHLKRLVFLNLKHCVKLKELPSSICMLKSLKNLILSYCLELNKLPENLGGIKSLTALLVDGCTLLTEVPISIGSLKKLEFLSASWCSSLNVLPESIGYLESLLDLNLDNTPIRELPDSMGLLSKLQKLSVRGCRLLHKIPNSIGRIESLSYLFLNETQVSEIPDFHASLCKLEKLEIRRCKLFSKLPDSIHNVQNLTALDIHGTIITKLPHAIGSLEKLEILNLNYCENLVELPDSIVNLRNLQYVYMNKTAIDRLPEDFGMLSSLVGLQMACCTKFKGFPEKFGSLARLRILDAKSCNLLEGAIPSDFGKLSSLEILDLSYNNFCSLPPSISGLSQLKRLHLQNCTKLRSLRELPSSLMVLDARICFSLKRLPDLSDLTSLQELRLSNCRSVAKLTGLERLESLRILDLSYCSSLVNSSLASSFTGFSQLKRLYLRDCTKLESLPELPSSLMELHASNCSVLEWLPDLSNLKDLSFLRLANCKKLAKIPGLEKLQSLKILNLVGCSSLVNTLRQSLVQGMINHLPNTCLPGSEIPGWFFPFNLCYEVRRDLDRVIKEVHLCIVFALEKEVRQGAIIRDMQYVIWRNFVEIYRTHLEINAIPDTNQDHIYFCRLCGDHPSLRLLVEGGIIQIAIPTTPVTEGIQLKKAGIYLVYDRPTDEASERYDRTISERQTEFFSFSKGSVSTGGYDFMGLGSEERHQGSRCSNVAGPSIAVINISSDGSDCEERRPNTKRLKRAGRLLSVGAGGSVGAATAQPLPNTAVRTEVAAWGDGLVLGASSEMPDLHTIGQHRTVEEANPMEIQNPTNFFTFL